MRLAVFVTPHGFGHAARAAAVLAALREELPALEATLFTSVPRWFFSESLDFSFDYRELACDVGFVQRSAVEEDLGATIGRLAELWTDAEEFLLKGLLSQLVASRAEAVLCDIAPLGLVAAREAGIPSILVESFTWDWIYEGVLEREPRFAPWIRRLREAFELATLRIQTEPVCSPAPGATRVGPIARRPRTPRRAVRARLGIGGGRSMVLVSLGGIESRIAHLERLELPGVDFVVPGGVAAGEAEAPREGLVLLPHHTPIFHPDLVHAADA
ncbi:MAG TPA: hypothetical protein VI942_11220, partial [Thermoanaerobaculia bacterium]|nr:hypothetical protein [Thermoanaerobaculia bacterium]